MHCTMRVTGTKEATRSYGGALEAFMHFWAIAELFAGCANMPAHRRLCLPQPLLPAARHFLIRRWPASAAAWRRR